MSYGRLHSDAKTGDGCLTPLLAEAKNGGITPGLQTVPLLKAGWRRCVSQQTAHWRVGDFGNVGVRGWLLRGYVMATA